VRHIACMEREKKIKEMSLTTYITSCKHAGSRFSDD